MSTDETLFSGENEDAIRKAMYIMLAWILVVVAAGIALVVFRDAFSGVFTLLGLF
ncbi:hypothetical protein [Natronosalvus vescus]|uniref:hypothetical protein n=1 Tax=Natronosalvus vescus TaxID=2953881 RepID=UPI0020912BA9|nr:hypothetical protein [Natronosalvus vescus]